jgi:ATP-dependent 26S proteasome regulatory subunit
MDGFSGALIEGACQKAGLQAIRSRQQNKGKISITQSMFEEQIRRIKKEREKMEA